MRRAIAAALMTVLAAAAGAEERLQVRLQCDEAEAALAVAAGDGEEAWQRVLASEGYRRLHRREAAMGRPFTDAEFRAFLTSPELAGRADALAATLAAWRRADLGGAAARALAYLPATARLRATVYPMIKPKENSFVFELESDPAIFLYLDPAKDAALLENTLAHELHHVGLAAACPDEPATTPRGLARRWAGAFSEGVAMLAAAGGADAHPHATSLAEDRARWDADLGRADADQRRVEAFLLDVASGRLAGDAVTAAGMEFFGIQGPWYTVGWRMASAVERAFGRERLVAGLCDPRALLADANAASAAGQPLPPWSAELLAALQP